MPTLTEILTQASERADTLGRAYAGELTPNEAYFLLQNAPGAKIVDVRTRAEWDWVGRVPEAVEIEWNQYPGGQRNPHFLAELKQQLDPEAIVMFLCRSGVRSIGAASAATEAGYRNSYNIMEGFEGDKDAQAHRNTVGGWRKHGLPWIQG